MKIIKIESCWECPYIQINSQYNFCGKIYRILSQEDTIPDWCPLEEAVDNGRSDENDNI